MVKTEHLKKETESLLMAVQDHTLATKAYRVTILKQQGSKMYRMCNDRDETHMHSFRECSKLAQPKDKKCHDKVANMVHWKLCNKYGFESVKRWYEHRVEGVIKSRGTKIL